MSQDKNGFVILLGRALLFNADVCHRQIKHRLFNPRLFVVGASTMPVKQRADCSQSELNLINLLDMVIRREGLL